MLNRRPDAPASGRRCRSGSGRWRAHLVDRGALVEKIKSDLEDCTSSATSVAWELAACRPLVIAGDFPQAFIGARRAVLHR